ncbi:MAG TPA: hypothetical protein VF472_21780 [Burkholderiaceae bacterium]
MLANSFAPQFARPAQGGQTLGNPPAGWPSAPAQPQTMGAWSPSSMPGAAPGTMPNSMPAFGQRFGMGGFPGGPMMGNLGQQQPNPPFMRTPGPQVMPRPMPGAAQPVGGSGQGIVPNPAPPIGAPVGGGSAAMPMYAGMPPRLGNSGAMSGTMQAPPVSIW